MGSGGLFFDFDNDGWIDIFLVDGGSLADPAVARPARHRLYRNRGDGTFEDVTATSGIRHREYGMGACAGDYDNDGWVDLYITNFGPNVLYRNRGDGTFRTSRGEAGVGSPLWSASCAFADVDRDGAPRSVRHQLRRRDPKAQSPFCGTPGPCRFYCHPLNFDPLPNTLYLPNDGKGRFTDVTSAPASRRISATASVS
jgi:enediyne biosynthesis protein E4